MSTWLHVNGMIRVDGLPMINNGIYSPKTLMDVIGPMFLPYFYCLNKYKSITIPPFQATYVTEHTQRDESALPSGSEGSLQYRVIEYDTGLPWTAVPFWGDLRDVETTDEVLNWLKDMCQCIDGECGFIRDCVVAMQIDGQRPVCYVLRRADDKIIFEQRA